MEIESFVFGPFAENTYVLYDQSKTCVIIDPGCFERYEETELVSFIQKKGLTPTTLLLTHAHIDHIAGLDFVAKTYALKPYMNPRDMYFLEHIEDRATNFGIFVNKYSGDIIPLDESSKLKFNNLEVKVMETPGHSPGSLCFLFGERFLIGGDVLFRESIGRTDLYMSDYSDLETSIRQKLYTLQDDTVVYPGHGIPTTIGHEKVYNPFVTAR